MQESLRAQNNAGRFEGLEECTKVWALKRMHEGSRA